MPIIRIIIPVYKAEGHLHRCVDSILAQSFTDFELLLVDDGSPDGSGKICDEYAAKDSRVKVLHKQNGGVSSARQTGIENAAGEYTIHADPDDWIEPTMLEELYNKATEEDADMVMCDYFFDETKKRKLQISSLLYLDMLPPYFARALNSATTLPKASVAVTVISASGSAGTYCQIWVMFFGSCHFAG